MILDRIENAARYTALHSAFAQAFEFLSRPGVAHLDEGKHVIDGERVYALVMRGAGKEHKDARLETHRRYIDIQFLIGGHEKVAWRPDAMLRLPVGPLDVENDAQFFTDKPHTWISLAPSEFVVFFPEDGHAGMIGEGEIHKVVVKVQCE